MIVPEGLKEKEKLIKPNGKLVNKHWYPTMCEGDVEEIDRCNIVRALHKLPLIK